MWITGTRSQEFSPHWYYTLNSALDDIFVFKFAFFFYLLQQHTAAAAQAAQRACAEALTGQLQGYLGEETSQMWIIVLLPLGNLERRDFVGLFLFRVLK